MNDVAPATNGAVAASDQSAFQALVTTGIISADEIRAMPLGTRIMLHDGLREFFWTRAKKLAASASCPTHLKGDEELCFWIIRTALNWNMDFYEVATNTYSPAPGAKPGMYGRLAVGAMLGSRKVKSISYEHGGDWNKVAGKFKMEPSKYKDGNVRMKDGKPVMRAVATYTAEDELGLYVIATATMHDGTKVPTPEVYLNSCHPRNSVVWDTNPRKQIMCVADRQLFDIACADVHMGVHFDVGLDEGQPEIKDITPPKAVDLEKEGVKGAGETAPMTEAGVVEEEPAPKAKSAPMPETTARRPRIKLTFGGKELYQTGFFADVKGLLDAVETPEAFDKLTVDIANAIASAEPKSGQAKLWEHVNPLIQTVKKEFDGAFSVSNGEIEHDQETGEIRDPNPEQTVAQAEELDLV